MRKLNTKICETCNHEFIQGYTVSAKKWETMRFCSFKCRRYSDETKLKSSQRRIGKKASKETKEKLSVFQKNRERKPFTIETRIKMSKSHIGKNMGEKNHSWKGGENRDSIRDRKNIEYRLWRESVYVRDSWTCQRCLDDSGGNLNPHHIKNFSSYVEGRFAIDNGITLCVDCHNLFHKTYGTRNNDSEQIRDFINNYTVHV